ncbi:MAG TPA: GIY-YIG nuclease family protein [Fibrobacteria bacterium]|nr:GIY-YIG nuclease family protein [Fibrobacteria bacterium]
MSVWNVYLLKCRDDSLYCGIATSVARRVAAHNAGKGAKYVVAARRPVVCVWTRRVRGHGEALRLEYWLKRLPVAQKRLIAEGVKTVRRTRDGWRLCRRGPTRRGGQGTAALAPEGRKVREGTGLPRSPARPRKAARGDEFQDTAAPQWEINEKSVKNPGHPVKIPGRSVKK